MPADIGHFKLIVRVNLFTGLKLEHDATAVAQPDTAAVGVERQVGIEQLAMPGKQRLNALLRCLFIAGEDENEIARRLPPGALQGDEVGDQHRRAGLIVCRAAAVEPAVAFDEGEGIHRPVVAPRRHNVNVSHEKNAGCVWVPPSKARHHVGDVPIRRDDLHVFLWKTRGDEPGGNRLCGAHRPVFLGAPNLDELFENFTRQCTVRNRRLLRPGDKGSNTIARDKVALFTSASFSVPASSRRHSAAVSQDAFSTSRTRCARATSRAREAAILPNDLPRRSLP